MLGQYVLEFCKECKEETLKVVHPVDKKNQCVICTLKEYDEIHK